MRRRNNVLLMLALLGVAMILTLPALSGATLSSGRETAPAGTADSGSLEPCTFSETPDADAGSTAIPGERDQRPFQSGWPQAMGDHTNYRPAGVLLADLNRDGDLEIIVNSRAGQLHVLHHDGTPLAGWTQPSSIRPSHIFDPCPPWGTGFLSLRPRFRLFGPLTPYNYCS